MSIKHKIKFKKSDRDRGTSPAVLRSSGPKQRPERVATKLGVSGESVRRDVPADEMEIVRFEEHDEKDYKEKCEAFFDEAPIFVNEDEEYCKHLAKFFKGNDKV